MLLRFLWVKKVGIETVAEALMHQDSSSLLASFVRLKRTFVRPWTWGLIDATHDVLYAKRRVATTPRLHETREFESRDRYPSILTIFLKLQQIYAFVSIHCILPYFWNYFSKSNFAVVHGLGCCTSKVDYYFWTVELEKDLACRNGNANVVCFMILTFWAWKFKVSSWLLFNVNVL